MKKRLIDIYSVDSKIKFFPFILALKRYNKKSLKDDILASISVALLTIPQSIAYSLLANLPVQAGIFTAIFGSIFSSAFGSSKHMVAGPSTGVSILVQMILSHIMNLYFPYLNKEQSEIVVLNILTALVFMVGIIQLIIGFLNFGKLLQFVSRSVILGYFAGVAIAIVVNQLFFLFDISSANTHSVIMRAYYFITHLQEINWLTLLIGALSLALLIMLKCRYKKFPNALTMVTFISLFVFFLNKVALSEHTRIPTLLDMGMIDVPPIKMIVPKINFEYLKILFFPALAISMLCILEVASISKAIGARSGQKTRSNQEVYGIGIANTILSFFYTAMPSSASVSRTTLNFITGGKSRFSAIYSGIITAILIFFFWPFVKHIPLCALSAMLIVMVVSVLEFNQVKLCFRATKGDALVFLLTMISCILFRLDIAFFIGIVISIVFFLLKAAEPNLVEYVFVNKNKLVSITPKRFPHRNIRIIGIAGELFFAAVDLFQNTLQKIIKEPDVKVVILRLKNIYHIDASICITILRLNDYLKSTNRYLLISGVTEEVWHIFQKAGLVKEIGRDKIFLTSEDKPVVSTKLAYKKAEELIS